MTSSQHYRSLKVIGSPTLCGKPCSSPPAQGVSRRQIGITSFLPFFSSKIGMFPKIVGFPPKSSHFNRVFRYKPNHPFWGTPIFGNIHRNVSIFGCSQVLNYCSWCLNQPIWKICAKWDHFPSVLGWKINSNIWRKVRWLDPHWSW